MCGPLVWLHALSIVGLVSTIIAAAIYDGKLESHFRQRHPEVWADLAQRKVILEDGGYAPRAAMHWYLLCGEHKKLVDEKLNSMVFTSRLWIVLLFCSVVALMLVQDRVSADAYRACLGFL